VYSIFTPAHRGGAGPPLVLLHGFTDTWRTWELVLADLERHHDVLAPTLLGHAGGPPVEGELTAASIPDAVERAMDAAGFRTAHIAGNSLGGFTALELAARGRAESVVALAPAGGWADEDQSWRATMRYFAMLHEGSKAAAPHAESLVATRQGRRRVTELTVTNFEHIPPELLVHQILGAAACAGAEPMIDYALRDGYAALDAARITCPVRVVWGTDDRLLPWPSAAARFRDDWLPHADWVELDGIGHCPQLDVPLEAAQLILGFTTS
jgi:pimeloyl-ACP methyl ester carboxylesterase